MRELPRANGVKKNNVQYAECPSCGQPVAANAGVTSGTCPHCGNVIPAKNSVEPSSNSGTHNVRIL